MQRECLPNLCQEARGKRDSDPISLNQPPVYARPGLSGAQEPVLSPAVEARWEGPSPNSCSQPLASSASLSGLSQTSPRREKEPTWETRVQQESP